MNRVFFIAFLFLAAQIHASTLTCSAFVANNLTSRHSQFGTDLTFATMHELESMHAYTNLVSVSMPVQASEALAGMWLRLSVSDPELRDFIDYAKVQIVSGQTQYTLSATTEADSKQYILSLHFAGNLNNHVLLPTSSTDIKVSHSIKGGIYDHTQVETLTLDSIEKNTDVINIPTTIELGSLLSGNNMSDITIDYELNTNSIGLQFRHEGTTYGSRLTVNNAQTLPTEIYFPPFNFGLYLYSDVPGVYSALINATWTCP